MPCAIPGDLMCRLPSVCGVHARGSIVNNIWLRDEGPILAMEEAPMLNMPWRKAQRVRRKWREELGNRSVLGSKRMRKPLLRVRATRLRACDSLVRVRKSEILLETNTEATPPIPMALTVLEMVQ